VSWKKPFSDKLITGEYGTMSEFRRKNNMQAHSGTDWAPKGNTPIPAIANGRVRLIQWSNILGWVVVQSARTKDDKLMHIGYCHLACDKHGVNCQGPKINCTEPFAIKMNQGVKVGQPFGMKVGNTGSASTGPHLHATLGKGIKDVFGPTAVKQDLKKEIERNV